MAKGSSSKNQDGGPTAEEKAVEVEGKRLRELALSRGLLSQIKANPAASLRPTKAILKCDGKDIVKKGHRKNKYLFAFPGLVAPVAGGKFGDLTQLDSRNPILYVDFPQGRLKFFGSIIYPKNKYLTLHFLRGAGNIICEDCFESLVVFSVAWWIGRKDENPEELRLEMPHELPQDKHSEFDFTAGAGRARDPQETIEVEKSRVDQDEPEILKGQLKVDEWLISKKPSGSGVKAKRKHESESDDDEGKTIQVEDTPTPMRQSARVAGKKYTYTESNSEEDEGTDSASDGSSPNLKRRKAGGKIVSKLFTSINEDNSFLVPETQQSKKDDAGPASGTALADTSVMLEISDVEDINGVDLFAASQTSTARGAGDAPYKTSVQVATASASAGGAKQSSLASFFSKTTKKDSQVAVEQFLTKVETKVETGTTRKYIRKKVQKQSGCNEDNTDDREEETPATKSKKPSVPRKTPSESKGSGAKGKSPSKKRELAVKETRAKEEPIEVSDDSEAS